MHAAQPPAALPTGPLQAGWPSRPRRARQPSSSRRTSSSQRCVQAGKSGQGAALSHAAGSWSAPPPACGRLAGTDIGGTSSVVREGLSGGVHGRCSAKAWRFQVAGKWAGREAGRRVGAKGVLEARLVWTGSACRSAYPAIHTHTHTTCNATLQHLLALQAINAENESHFAGIAAGSGGHLSVVSGALCSSRGGAGARGGTARAARHNMAAGWRCRPAAALLQPPRPPP